MKIAIKPVGAALKRLFWNVSFIAPLTLALTAFITGYGLGRSYERPEAAKERTRQEKIESLEKTKAVLQTMDALVDRYMANLRTNK
jgi:hypothetical protein